MTGSQWSRVAMGALAALAGLVLPVRARMNERARRICERSGTPWWFGFTMVPVGGLFALAGWIDFGWPVLLAFVLVYGLNALGRRVRTDVENPPPMLALLDRAPLNPFWGIRRPKEWSPWITDLFSVRKNQREFRAWEQRHGLCPGPPKAGPT